MTAGLTLRATASSLAIAAACLLFPFAGTAQNPSVTITVDARAGRRPIDPNIYGVAYATHGAAQRSQRHAQSPRRQHHDALQLAAERRQSRQRLVLREHRRRQRDGRRTGRHVHHRDAGRRTRQPMLTIPTIEWVAKVGPNREQARAASRSRSTERRQAPTGSGSPTPATASAPTAPTSPATIPTTPTSRNSPTLRAGLDPAPHRHVGQLAERRRAVLHPRQRAGHLEPHPPRHSPERRHAWTRLRDASSPMRRWSSRSIPNAQILGPEEWGWTNYFISGATSSRRTHELGTPDRTLTAALDSQPWLLDQLRQHDTATGQRLLDYFTLHFYPQGGAVQRRRLHEHAASAQSLDAQPVGPELRR